MHGVTIYNSPLKSQTTVFLLVLTYKHSSILQLIAVVVHIKKEIKSRTGSINEPLGITDATLPTVPGQTSVIANSSRKVKIVRDEGESRERGCCHF